MNGFVTSARFDRVINLPLALPQTELRGGKAMTLVELALARHQRLELRSLSLTLLAVLTPGAVPVYLNTALGLCSVGFYRSDMLTAPLALVTYTDQAATVNPFSPCVVETPGNYLVIASNNTSNIDLAVCATGSLKLLY